jgi:hypothetical protein
MPFGSSSEITFHPGWTAGRSPANTTVTLTACKNCSGGHISSLTDILSSQIPISWEELVSTILEPVYNGSAKDEEIALFFIVCATGVSMDHQKQPDDPVARRYAHLARISLMLGDDLLCSKSLTVIKCLVRGFSTGCCSSKLTVGLARAGLVLSHLLGPCRLLKGLDAHCNGRENGTSCTFLL